MAEIGRVICLKPEEILPVGTRFRFITCSNNAYGPYLVSGMPFTVGSGGKQWNRGIVTEEGPDGRVLTSRDTVILPGVKIAVYNKP
jgi:hypothetical protein